MGKLSEGGSIRRHQRDTCALCREPCRELPVEGQDGLLRPWCTLPWCGYRFFLLSSLPSRYIQPAKKKQKKVLRSVSEKDQIPVLDMDTFHPLSHDPKAVKLCQLLMQVTETLKRYVGGRYAESKPGADIFDITINQVTGSVEVRCQRDRHSKQAAMSAANKAAKRCSHDLKNYTEDWNYVRYAQVWQAGITGKLPSRKTTLRECKERTRKCIEESKANWQNTEVRYNSWSRRKAK
eukprot:g30729.t1